jgi:hypothetical protein
VASDNLIKGDRFVASLKIRIFKDNEPEPKTTITVPLAIVRVAAKLIPEKTMSALLEIGIDAELLVAVARQDDVRGTLVEIEEHTKNKKIIIAIE